MSTPRPAPVSAAPRIQPLPPALAGDHAVVGEITELINAVYLVAEADLWSGDVQRTDVDEVAASIAAGHILVARSEEQILGVVQTRVVDGLGWFGMLAVDPRARGLGIGGRLIEAAEHAARDAGADAMRIEVLTPSGISHRPKADLTRWYERHGYQRIGTEPLPVDAAELTDLLAVPCHLEVLRKPLPARGG